MAVDSRLPLALWVVPVAEFGGVARHVCDVAEAGLPGYDLAVLLPAGQLSARLQSLGITVVTADFGTAAGFFPSLSALLRVVGQLRPAVVHSHLAYADIVAAVAVVVLRLYRRARGSVNPPLLVTTEHGIAGDSSVYHGSALKARGRALAHRLRLRVTDRAIAVSASTAEQMRRRWGASRVDIVRNGVDPSEIAARVAAHRQEHRGGGPRVLSLSRLAPEKNLPLVLEAFAQVRETYPQASLEMAGTGEMLPELEELAVRLKLGESVRFTGFVDPLQAMGRNDILVQLSRWENLSYTLLDAKAVPMRVVATDVGGNREIVAEQELVPPVYTSSAVSSIARRIVQLWERPPAAGHPAQSVKQMVAGIVACYGRKS